MNKYLTLFLVLIFAAGCQDQEAQNRRIERIVKQHILAKMNANCRTFEMEKEADDRFLITTALENGENMQVIFEGTEADYKISETLNSQIARQVSRATGLSCRRVQLGEADAEGYYAGEAEIESGEVFKIMAHLQKGFYPADAESVKTFNQLLLQTALGTEITEFELVPTEGSSEEYEARLLTKDQRELKLHIHQKMGWYPINEAENLRQITHLQMLTNKIDVDSVYIDPAGESFYSGWFTLKSGEKWNLKVTHDGQNFRWEPGEQM